MLNGMRETAAAATAPTAPTAPTTMRVRKRNGSLEGADLNKIVRAISRCCDGLRQVDAIRVATKTIAGLFDGASTKELDQLSIQTAASLTLEEPEYAKLANRFDTPAGKGYDSAL